jgi:tetratricopeptide (TPR) repeat protein
MRAAGVAYFAAGSDEAAARAYRSAIVLEPTSIEAKRMLAKVLNRRARDLVDKNDLVHALVALEEANGLVPDDLMTSRNLALGLLMSKKYIEAERTLERPLQKVPEDMILNRLMGRALLGQAKRDAAMAAYERAAKTALRVRGVDLAGVYTELGPLYLEDPSRLDTAVTVLEQAVKEAGNSPVLPVAQRNLAIALFRRGMTRLRDPKDSEGALDDVVKASQSAKNTFSAKELIALACAEAFAALKNGKISEAEDAFARAGNGCQVRPPWDRLGVQFFAAYAGYRDSNNPGKREAACRSFQQLQSKASGVASEWVRQLSRSCWELLAYDWFQRSDEKRAEMCLKNARKIPAKGDVRDLEHNLAVIDMFFGRFAQAERTFDVQGRNGKPAESLVNLGIIRDRQGDAKKALDLYKKALERGARAPKLKEWIDVKERLFEVRS